MDEKGNTIIKAKPRPGQKGVNRVLVTKNHATPPSAPKNLDKAKKTLSAWLVDRNTPNDPLDLIDMLAKLQVAAKPEAAAAATAALDACD